MNEWIPKLISSILSILDASTLRNRMYQNQQEHELMWTVLDDIARMHPEHDSGLRAKQVLTKVTNRYTK